MKASPMPSLQRLEELFSLDPESPSGLRWRVSRPGVRASGVAGSLKPGGYCQVMVDGKMFLAHRIVWVLVNRRAIPPGLQVDHIDGCRGNSRPENLRLATNQENQRNTRLRKDNASGVKGVYWKPASGRWQAQIRVDGKLLSLGYFTTLEEAAAARREAETRYFGEFRRAA